MNTVRLDLKTASAAVISATMTLAPSVKAAPVCEGETTDSRVPACVQDPAETPKPAERAHAKAPSKPRPQQRRPASKKDLKAASVELALLLHEGVEKMAHGPDEGFRYADEAAERTTSPSVKIAASKLILVAPATKLRLDRAAMHTNMGLELLDKGPRLPKHSEEELRITGASVLATVDRRREELNAKAEASRAAVKARNTAKKARGDAERRIRRGNQEVIAGSGMLALVGLGAGIAVGGAIHLHQVDEAKAELRGQEERYDLTPLAELERQGTQMIAAGAILGLIGAGAGVPLVIIGARDRRAGKQARENAGTIEVHPTLGGLSVRGRF